MIVFLIISICLLKMAEGQSCYTYINNQWACWNYPTCYQDTAGNYYNCPSSGRPTFVYWNYNYCNGYDYYYGYCYSTYTVTINQDCDGRCSSCYGTGYGQCYTCYAPYYKMSQYYTCDTYCPTGNYLTSGGVIG